MQAVIFNSKEKKLIEYKIKKASSLMQEIIDKAIEDGKKQDKYALGFEYPANQAAFAQMELNKIHEIINKE